MQLKGILPALVTPFDANGETDFKTLGRLIEWHLSLGVHGFVPMGSTGEYYAMSDDERNAVLKFVRETVGDRGQLIAALGRSGRVFAIAPQGELCTLHREIGGRGRSGPCEQQEQGENRQPGPSPRYLQIRHDNGNSRSERPRPPRSRVRQRRRS